MKNLSFLVIFLSIFRFCHAQELKSANKTLDASTLLTWNDLNLILHSSPLMADSIMKAKNFVSENQRTYSFSGADGIIVTVQLINENMCIKSFNVNANSSAFCDDLYQQMINYLFAKHIESIISCGNDIAFFETERLFRVRMDTFKYSHYGLEILSD